MRKLKISMIESKANEFLNEFKNHINMGTEEMFFPSKHYDKLEKFISGNKKYSTTIVKNNNNDDMNAFNGLSGCARKNEQGETEIYINIQDDSKRQKFTLMHEFGHVFLNHLASTQVDSYNKNQTNSNLENVIFDKQANIFAANVLMPKYDFKKLCVKYSFNTKKISNYLGLSKSAVRIRMMNVL